MKAIYDKDNEYKIVNNKGSEEFIVKAMSFGKTNGNLRGYINISRSKFGQSIFFNEKLIGKKIILRAFIVGDVEGEN